MKATSTRPIAVTAVLVTIALALLLLGGGSPQSANEDVVRAVYRAAAAIVFALAALVWIPDPTKVR